MANIDGAWHCSVTTPMGPQDLVLTIRSDGDSFTGTATGELGSLDLEDGRIEGDTAYFKLRLKMPLPMTLEGQATVAGDTLAGSVAAGAFGSWSITGTRG